ncbi:hypothetical protein D3C78_1809100 [compost metagenome]
MLTGAPAARIAVATQAQRQHVFGHPLAPLDAGEHPVQAPAWLQPGQYGIHLGLAQPAPLHQPAQWLQQRTQGTRPAQRD